MGLPFYEGQDNEELNTAWDLIEHFREKDRLLSSHLSPVDTRIQNFLDGYFADVAGEAGDSSPSTPIGVNLPNNNWIRQQHGSKSVSLGNITGAFFTGNGAGLTGVIASGNVVCSF